MVHEPNVQQPYLLPLRSTVVIILGGGRGTRLFPLTEYRSKPAVPLGGKFRIIDIPISNCIHSNLQKIYVLTQYQSASLNRHVNLGFKFDAFSRGFVEVMAAEITEQSEEWFQGTADAVRKQFRHFERWYPRYYLILSGDQIYRMDYRHLIAHHVSTGADVTVSVLPVGRKAATGFGLLHIDKTGRIIDFHEKPKDPRILDRYRIPHDLAGDLGISTTKEQYLASMGIYLFNRDVLVKLLESDQRSDFGKHVIPDAIRDFQVQSYVFNDYWEDIGTIEAYYEANLALARRKPAFDLHDWRHPIYTNVRHLSPTRVFGGRIDEVLLSDGGVIEEADIRESVIGVRAVIGKGCKITRTVMVGADHYDTPDIRANFGRGAPPLGIGSGTTIEKAILDKNVRIGKNVRIVNEKQVAEVDEKDYSIREGIVIVRKNAVIKDGTVI